jgi:hypothetical protein
MWGDRLSLTSRGTRWSATRCSRNQHQRVSGRQSSPAGRIARQCGQTPGISRRCSCAWPLLWLHASQTVRAIPASREEAALLGIQPKAALLHIERVSYSTQELAVEFLRVFYRGDRYVLFNEWHA